MTNLAIIIVSWNVKTLLIDCLRSVEADLAGSRLSAQIWVVDNASADDTAATLRRDFPHVQLIASETLTTVNSSGSRAKTSWKAETKLLRKKLISL